MDKGVIYEIKNLKNGKSYIGQTIDLNRRIREHKYKDKLVIEKAIDKYGWDSFEVRILEDNVPRHKLDVKEVKYIERYNTFEGRGYNCTEGGEGQRLSEKTKKKMSKNHADVSGENHPMYGKHLTEETKAKLSEAQRGENNPMYGKNYSKAMKEKIREAQQGEKGNSAKLTNAEVKVIKQLLGDGSLTHKMIGQIFNVAESTISNIASGQSWSHVEIK